MHITMTEYCSIFIVEFKIKCFPASWPSIAFSDTDIMLHQFCLTYLGYVLLPSYIFLTAIIVYEIERQYFNPLIIFANLLLAFVSKYPSYL